MPNTYETAIKVLSDADIKRILCIFLNTKDGVIDWQKATTEFGSASVASMRTSLGNTMRKVRDSVGNEDGNASSAATPTPKKRKAKTPARDNDDDEEETSVPKKRGRPSKKAKAEVDGDEQEIKAGFAVKEEVDDDY